MTVLAKTKSRSLFKKFCLSVGKAVLRQCWMACNKSEEEDAASASDSEGAVPSGYISRTQPTSSSSCRLLLYSSASGSKYSNRMDDDRNDVEVTIDDGDIDSNDDSDKDCSFAFNFTVLIGDDDDDDDDEVENALQTDPKNRGVVSIVLIEEKHNNRNTTPSNCTAIIVNFSLLSSLFLSSLIYSKPSFTILHLPR